MVLLSFVSFNGFSQNGEQSLYPQGSLTFFNPSLHHTEVIQERLENMIIIDHTPDWPALPYVREYRYDSLGRIKLLYEYDEHNPWYEKTRIFFSYNLQGLMEEELQLGRNEFGDWIDILKKEYYYANENILPSEVTIYAKPQGNWRALDRWNYTYDTSGNILETIYMTNSGGIWFWVEKTEVIRQPNQNIVHIYAATDTGWFHQKKIISSLTEERRVTQSIEWNLEEISPTNDGGWVQKRKHNYQYDSLGNILTYRLSMFYDGTPSSQWVSLFEDRYEYDTQIRVEQLQLPPLNWIEPLNSEYMTSKPMAIRSFLPADGANANSSWILQQEKILFYVPYLSGVQTSGSPYQEFAIFPNPAKNFIRFKNKTQQEGHLCEIYSFSGSFIFSAALGSEGEIDISALKPGMYYGHIHCSDKTGTFRFVKSE